jgi:hypothetical protein
MDADVRTYGSNFDSRGGIVTLRTPIHETSSFRSFAFICNVFLGPFGPFDFMN